MKTRLMTLNRGPVIGLPKRQILSVAGVRGLRIESRRGSIWVTQDGDPRDVVLAQGQSLVVERDGPLLVQALDAAWVSISEPAAAARPVWWRRLTGAVVRPALGVPLRVSA